MWEPCVGSQEIVFIAELQNMLPIHITYLFIYHIRWRLKVNWEKSKVMRMARKGEECQVMFGGEELEQVDTMKYLGVMVSGDGSMDREVEQELGVHLELLGE